MRRASTILAGLLLGLLSLVSIESVAAQDEQPDFPYYVVEAGDSLWDIAWRFGLSPEELGQANGISDANQISTGARLVIPGLQGIQGRVDTRTVPFGETLRSLSRRYRAPEETLARLNRLTSPSEIYAGATLIAPADDGDSPILGRASLAPGQSLLELAVIRGVNPWAITIANDLPGSWGALLQDPLRLPGEDQGGPGALPEAVTRVSLEPLLPVQGKTTIVKISGETGMTIGGTWAGRELSFFPYEDGYVALHGIHALETPGLYPLSLRGELPSGEPFAFTQAVMVRSGNYPYDPVLLVDPATLDEEVTVPEDELWASLAVPVTPEKMWAGLFGSPVPAQFKDCWTSLFGSRRSYNGSPYNYYHSGLDFCGTTGTELFASAAGTVVYTGSLAVRGDVIVIDHGWGVYTAYDHLSGILVEPGERVETGQLIGLGGSTGRSTGPHLHWEVWVGGVAVDPLDWLEKDFP